VGVGVAAGFEPKGLEETGALANPVGAGAVVPKPDADEPKLNVVEAAGDGLAVVAPNPPKVGAGEGAGAAGVAPALLVAPKLNVGIAGGLAAGVADAAVDALVEPKEKGELAAGLGASAGLPNVKEGVDGEALLEGGAGEPKLNDAAGAGVVLVCAGAPNRLGVDEAGAFTFASKDVDGVVFVFPNANKLLLVELASAGLSAVAFASVVVDAEGTAANGLPAGNEDATAGATTGAAAVGAVEKLNSPAFGGATLQ
jgi:hypothetical protein